MMEDSTITKMQLHYWEAKQTFLKKIKRKEDDFLVASDAELDAKLELLKSIDETNQNLLNLLELYQDRVFTLAQEQCLFGRFLRDCCKHNDNNSLNNNINMKFLNNLMSSSGKTFLFAGHQFITLKNILIRSYRDIQTFQYRAVIDTFNTVERMEKSRNAYRAALLWMKDISKKLDPEQWIQIDKFKKIQNHVREKKNVFEKYKLDTIQKIDLLSASRCNLFNNILYSYQQQLKSVWSKTIKTMNIFIDIFNYDNNRNFLQQNYQFKMLKELNDINVNNNQDNNNSCNDIIENFEEKLKEILKSNDNSSDNNGTSNNNDNDLDMLIFFEADYTDDDVLKDDEKKKDNLNGSNNSVGPNGPIDPNKMKKFMNKRKHYPTSTSSKSSSSSSSTTAKTLTDFIMNDKHDNDDNKSKSRSPNTKKYMPSSLIDLEQLMITNQDNDNKAGDGIESSQTNTDSNFNFFDKFISHHISQPPPSSSSLASCSANNNGHNSCTNDQEAPTTKSSSKSSTSKNQSSLDTWLNLFSDIDPLSNPQEFDKRFSSDKFAVNDRNC